MNKKKKEPEYIYPFKDAKHEADEKFMDIVMMNDVISEKGSKIRLVKTDFNNGYMKFSLTETVYVSKKGMPNKLSEILHLMPQDQIRREKYLVFDISTDKKGNMLMVKKDNPTERVEFSKNYAELIKYFYRLSSVTLEDVSADLGTYKNDESVRQATIKINRKFSANFTIPKECGTKLIEGETRHGYWFNRYVHLNTVAPDTYKID